MEVLQRLPLAHSSELPGAPTRGGKMGAPSVDGSSSSSSKYLRSWSGSFLGRSLCRDVSAYSPSPLSRSASSSQSSSQPNSIRSSSRNYSFREVESPSKLLNGHRKMSRPTPARSASASRRQIASPELLNSRKPQKVVERKQQQQQFQQQKQMIPSTKGDNVAGGYALALADLANTMGCLDVVNKDVEHLAQLLENEELYEFLTSPEVLDSKKKSILRTIAEDVGFHEYSSTFLYALVERRRILQVKEVVREFDKIYNDMTNTHVATVTSATKMDALELAAVAEKIKSLSGATNVRTKNVVDPSLIAGYVIDKDGSRFIDMSVKGQLDRLAPQFEPSPRGRLF